MKKRKRRWLDEFCESRGFDDQCDNCPLYEADIPNACDFRDAPDEDIDKMVEVVESGGYKYEEDIK